MDCMDCCSWVPSVESCCCCHSLEIGTKLISLIEIVYTIAAILGESTMLGYLHPNAQASAGVDIALEMLMLVASILLMIGMLAKIPQLINVWLICEFIFVVAGILHTVAIFIEISLNTIPFIQGLLLLLYHFGAEAMSMYFFIVVYNYYEEEVQL